MTTKGPASKISGLCLTRRVNESVVIETTQGIIEVLVVEIGGRSTVKLLFASDNRDIIIHRKEVHEKIKEQRLTEQD
jgi:carbon storage regulator CsrA